MFKWTVRISLVLFDYNKCENGDRGQPIKVVVVVLLPLSLMEEYERWETGNTNGCSDTNVFSNQDNNLSITYRSGNE